MSRNHFTIFVAVLLLASGWDFAATHEQIEQAIENAQNYLIRQQDKAGTWEEAADAKTGAMNENGVGHRPGERTALVTYALQASGRDWRATEMKPAVDFVLHADIDGVFGVGFSSQLSVYLSLNETREILKRNAHKLLAGLQQPAADAADRPEFWDPRAGFYGDRTADGRLDRTNSGYGVQGMYALSQSDGEIPISYWKIVDAAWKQAQLGDGGWCATPRDHESTPLMTAMGTATLLITEDQNSSANWSKCVGIPRNQSVERGLRWLDQHFDQIVPDTETMLAVARIAHTTGRRYFGGKDWYEVGVQFLLNRQLPDGSFAGPQGPVAGTSFTLLFLSTAREPCMMNKLRYAAGPESRVADPWNERPGDVLHLAKWAARQMCWFDFNWQVVDPTETLESLHDAPILYVSGSQALHFSDGEKDKLRAYVEEGGLILGNADCGREEFSKSFIALGHSLFPKYQFREVGSEDLIYHEMFREFRSRPRVLELHNGIRKLMLLIPDTDPARAWQTRSTLAKEDAFDLAANIYLYAIDKRFVTGRGGSNFPKRDVGIQATRSLKMARLDLGDNSDPEPGGWRRMAAVMHNSHQLDLAVDHISAGQLAKYKVAHLTGTGKLDLSDESRAAIQSFVRTGGTLIVDAAGGDVEFADSFQVQAAATFPDNALDLLPPDDAIYHYPGCEMDKIRWRDAALERLRNKHVGALQAIKFGKRIGVYFSRQDLSCGLVGQPVDGVYGYEPTTATTLMSAMLLYAADHQSGS
jgi:hypothetical protein